MHNMDVERECCDAKKSSETKRRNGNAGVSDDFGLVAHDPDMDSLAVVLQNDPNLCDAEEVDDEFEAQEGLQTAPVPN